MSFVIKCDQCGRERKIKQDDKAVGEEIFIELELSSDRQHLRKPGIVGG